MSAIYLPIRSFGDFIISASVIKNQFTDKIPIILPVYLKEFFDAAKLENYFNVIKTITFYDQPAFYELYKIKNATEIKRLFSDIKKIYDLGADKNTFLLDYSSKRISFIGAKLIWPEVNKNIYSGKFEMFSNYFERKRNAVSRSTVLNSNLNDRILIIPGSRLKSKAIDNRLVNYLIETLKGNNIEKAEFGNISGQNKKGIYYSNFKQLIDLINNYDLIVSAESLPYHLAYYLNKAHFVIFNESKHFKSTFITPFMEENNSYVTFNGENKVQIADRLKEVLNYLSQTGSL